MNKEKLNISVSAGDEYLGESEMEVQLDGLVVASARLDDKQIPAEFAQLILSITQSPEDSS